MEYCYVLDCSLTISWLFIDEETESALSLRKALVKSKAIVPELWSIEVGNVLWVAEKKQKITPYQTTLYKNLLQELPIETDKNTSNLALSRIIELAREYKITVYDACYLELALRFSCPVATFDNELRQAANKAGIPVLP